MNQRVSRTSALDPGSRMLGPKIRSLCWIDDQK